MRAPGVSSASSGEGWAAAALGLVGSSALSKYSVSSPTYGWMLRRHLHRGIGSNLAGDGRDRGCELL